MKKQHIDSKGNTWEWEETPETLKAIKKYWETVKRNEQQWN